MRVLSPSILLAALLLGACHDEPAPPRGVLLISIDSLRKDHLSCYGYKSKTAPTIPTTPRIDARLAAEGLRFERAVSTTSWTLPAHMALMTGQPDELHGVKSFDKSLDPSHATLASVLQKAGWRTAGFWSGINLHPTFGFDRGFEHYDNCSTVAVSDEAVLASNDPAVIERLRNLNQASHQGITSPKLVKAFDSWMDGIEADEKFFAFVHFWDVHYDYAAPPEDDVFYPGYSGDLDGSNYNKLEKQNPRDPADVDRLISLYDAEIRFTDKHVEMLLDRLKRDSRLDDTLVILVSDHGEEFFEHDRFGHYHTLFEEVVRVPMIMRWPAGFEPGRNDDLVSLTDVAPTILELCNVPSPKMWGRSLAHVQRERLEPRVQPLEVTFHKPQNFWRGAHFGDQKVIQFSKDPIARFFDLKADPFEITAIEEPAAQPSQLTAIQSARGAWSQLEKEAARLAPGMDHVLPAELQSRLNEIGYGEDRSPEDPKKGKPDDEPDGNR